MTANPNTATAMAARLASGEATAASLLDESLARAAALNPRLNALLAVHEEEAREAAAASDARRAAGAPLSPFDGVPIAVKDNICVRGRATTCASRMLAGFRPPYDAHAAERLAAAGLVVVGKANLDEFAMGSSTEHSAFGPSRNPWDDERVPGGSSGGSAVAVASGMVPWSLGSDTGGSIRQPAGFCGLVGLKPTYGRVSRYGLVAFASSLDQIGPFALDVRDAAALLGIIAGHDRRDSTSIDRPVDDYAAAAEKASLAGTRIARPREFFDADGIEPGIRAACAQALEKAASLGAEVVDISMPYAMEYAISTYYVLATAEASSNLARYDGAHYGHRAQGAGDIVEMFSRSRAEGFGAEVKRRIMLGTFVLSAETFDAYYVRAQKARAAIKAEFDRAFGQVDLIAAPTSPFAPFRLGERTGDPLAMYLADAFTLSLNLSGACGLSMPAGFDDAGLPVGLQLWAAPFREAGLLRGAAALEHALGVVHSRRPACAA